MDIAVISGFMASAVCSIIMVPQVYKTIRTKESYALSANMLVLSTLGNIFWLINAWAMGNVPLIVSACMILILNVPLFYMKYKNKELLSCKDMGVQIRDLCLSLRSDTKPKMPATVKVKVRE